MLTLFNNTSGYLHLATAYLFNFPNQSFSKFHLFNPPTRLFSLLNFDL